jgi:hypothetical protein
VSINAWRLAGDTLNVTCNVLYCNHQVHRDFLITVYNSHYCELPLFKIHINIITASRHRFSSSVGGNLSFLYLYACYFHAWLFFIADLNIFVNHTATIRFALQDASITKLTWAWTYMVSIDRPETRRKYKLCGGGFCVQTLGQLTPTTVVSLFISLMNWTLPL